MNEQSSYKRLPLRDLNPELLRDLIEELLTDFSPFISAWEANNPYYGTDGEELAKRMRQAIGAPLDYEFPEVRRTSP